MYVIYGQPNCQWCNKAIGMLEARGLEYQYRDIIHDEDDYNEFIFYFPGRKTVPAIIFYLDEEDNDEVEIIGGYEELYKSLITSD